MIGIVLWSDPSDRKAVFWCEDQGDLAYFEAPNSPDNQQGLFYAGDMVQFSVTADRTMRLAHDATLLEQRACTQLPESLRQAAHVGHDDARNSARIIPFKPHEDAEAPCLQMAGHS